MKIHEINHPSSESIFNGDFLSENNFIFINKKSRIYRNNEEINFKIEAEWPLIRIISDEVFILVNSDSSKENDSA